MTMGPRSR